MRRLGIKFLPLGIILLAIGFLYFLKIHSALAECRTDAPPVKLTIKLYSSDPPCNNGSNEAREPLPLNCPFTFDVTAKAADGCLNDGSRNVQMFYPADLLQKLQRGSNPFVPWFKALADGQATVYATLDSLKSNELTITLGKGGDGSSDSESGNLCCYKNISGTYSRVPNSGIYSDCSDIPFCVDLAKKVPTNPCVIKPADECPSEGGLPLGAASSSFKLPPPAEPPPDLGALITAVFNWSLAIVGIVVFVMILYGGATWLVAAGSPELVGKAKTTIRNALLGMFLLLAAYLILNTINPDFVKQSTTLEPLHFLK